MVNDLLASLSPTLRENCQAYYQARDAYLATNTDYRKVMAEHRAASMKMYHCQEVLTGPHDENRNFSVGTLCFNLRNRRFYEVAKVDNEGVSYDHSKYVSLCVSTGRRGKSSLYYNWGPIVPVPSTHPFYQLRAKARLAERLEGKDVA